MQFIASHVLRVINKMWCQKREKSDSSKWNTWSTHLHLSVYFSSAMHEILTVYVVSHSQHDCICSLGLFMNLRCMLIESVLKHQIKFALFLFIRIKWNKIRSNAKRIFAFNVLCSVFALSLHGTCLSVVFFMCVCSMFEAWHGSLRYMMGSMLHTPYHIWLTVNNLHITHVIARTHTQWPLCACDESLCIWIKCCSTHMITEKSHSADRNQSG